MDRGVGIPVLDPSSMILHVICPSLRISPDVAGTKLMGLLGIAMVARACLASSSIVTLELMVMYTVEMLLLRRYENKKLECS